MNTRTHYTEGPPSQYQVKSPVDGELTRYETGSSHRCLETAKEGIEGLKKYYPSIVGMIDEDVLEQEVAKTVHSQLLAGGWGGWQDRAETLLWVLERTLVEQKEGK